MEYVLRFCNASWLYFLIPAVIIIVFLRLKFAKGVFYKYSLGNLIKKNGFASRHWYKKIFFFLRFLSLIILALLIAKPQLVDPRSNVLIEGIDMVLALDMSGSMENDFGKGTRFDVAKREAIRFIEKREHDPIGLVIFARGAVSRCPITVDRHILKNIIKDLELGFINKRGTCLFTAILNAANRLKNSKSKSKVIILLTDGSPAGETISPDIVMDVVKKLGIKIYTVGIGKDEDDFPNLPRHYLKNHPALVNKELLKEIASLTGGKFFMAKNKKDMRNIYKTIDALEKTEYKTNIYSKYFDIFMPFLWAVFIILLFEIFFTLFIWFGV